MQLIQEMQARTERDSRQSLVHQNLLPLQRRSACLLRMRPRPAHHRLVAGQNTAEAERNGVVGVGSDTVILVRDFVSAESLLRYTDGQGGGQSAATLLSSRASAMFSCVSQMWRN